MATKLHVYKLWCDTRLGLWNVMLETIATGEWHPVFGATVKETCESWMRDNPLPGDRSQLTAHGTRTIDATERELKQMDLRKLTFMQAHEQLMNSVTCTAVQTFNVTAGADGEPRYQINGVTVDMDTFADVVAQYTID